MPRQRHWINLPHAQLVFCTTTVLNFVHAFREPWLRGIMTGSLLHDHRHYGVVLHSFVVMSHHMHFVSYLPENRTMSWFMERVKSNAAKRILPRLPQRYFDELSDQTGLNKRTFWQRSFRGIGLEGGHDFWTRVNYVHYNPVRAELCEQPGDYHWSSGRLWDSGLWGEEQGLPITDELISEFCHLGDLRIRGGNRRFLG
jgi:putative transposase